MTKVKLLSWNATAKEVKLKSGSDIQILKVTSSLFARMLVIAWSSREDIDLETVIGTTSLHTQTECCCNQTDPPTLQLTKAQ